MAYTLADKPTSWHKAVSQARRSFDPTLLRELGESMRVKQLQPVGAMNDGTLLWGERRLRAAVLVGLPTLLTLVTDEALSESQAKLITLTENLLRENLTGYETWSAAAELMSLNPSWSKKTLADAIKKDPSSITRILSPDDCIDDVREALRLGRIGIRACYDISKVDRAMQPAMLAKALGGSADDVAREGRKQRGGGTANATAVRLTRIKCELPTGVNVVASGEGISLDEYIDSLGDALKEAKKARDLGLNAKTWSSYMRDKAHNGS